MKRIRLGLPLLLLTSLLLTGSASASTTIFLGFDIQTPVQMYTTAGGFLGNFGQDHATGSALDGAGHVWTVAPGFGSNHIEKYDAAQTVLNSFTAAVSGNWIEDMAYGGGNTLWVGTYEGNIFNIDATTGAVNSGFAVASSNFTGVAFDGTDLWAGSGFGSDAIYRYSTTGTLLATIHTGFVDGGGLGYDPLTNTLWQGYFGDVRQFDLSGNLLSSFTAGTAFHDGLEIGPIGGSVPEPTSLFLLGGGLGALLLRRRRS